MPDIIDSGDWLRKRLRHLEAALESSPTDEERQAIQAEIDQLKNEAKKHRRGLWRWAFWGARLPGR